MFGNLIPPLAHLSLETLNGFYCEQNDEVSRAETTTQVSEVQASSFAENTEVQSSSLSFSNLIQMKEIGSIDQKRDLKRSIELNFELVKNRLEHKNPITAEEIKSFYQLLFNPQFKDHAISQMTDPYHPATVIYHLHDAILASQSNDPELKMKPTSADKFQGINASYFLPGLNKQRLWVYKPAKGEAGCAGTQEKPIMGGIKPGEGIIREKLANLLNYHKKFPIPYTTCIELNGEIGSAQAFRSNCLTFSELLTETQHQDKIAKISVIQLQAVSVFDLLFYNGDRHIGNILWHKDNYELVAIDHGACMTISLEDPLKMEYLAFPQMNQPYAKEIQLLIVKENDIEKNASEMRRLGIEEQAIQWMRSVSSLLKTAVQLSNEQQEKLKVQGLDIYLSPTDVALLIMDSPTVRNKLLVADNHADYLNDILVAKIHIQEKLRNKTIDLNDQPETIAQLAWKELQKTKYRKAWSVRPEWLTSLFSRIVPHYIEMLKQ